MDDFNLVSEPQFNWGGNWTERKLIAFSKYVSAYLTIMNRYPYWETIYFDGFAGSGHRVKDESQKELFTQLFPPGTFDEDGYKGAAERVLSLPDAYSFDHYYFVDADEESLEKLKQRLSVLQQVHGRKINFLKGDCNEHLLQLAKKMKHSSKYASLVFLDPFGMQINWNSIASLQGTRTDIWILVPTGVIVNRLLDRKGELRHLGKLEEFFGITEEEIRRFFYRVRKQRTLFGETNVVEKVKEPIEKIATLYIQRLKTIWKYALEEPLVLRNNRNTPIFHFVFASNNAAAVKIAKDIIKGL